MLLEIASCWSKKLDEINTFLETYNLLKVTAEEIENLNQPYNHLKN